ncbi:MAG: hypothetical protein GWM88_05360 [Pseudomonadales bacterium]|nr:hypothetical protein [Pseudomonadales bacterium]NIX07463.1 hypothetical protein [Pseudomonadales bacterium]
MSIMELGALGEFLGSLGVIATLAYLAVQIRHNTRATQTASHHAITDSLNQGNIAQASDPELARIWLSGSEDRASLSDVDRQRLDMLLLAYFHVFDSLFYSANRGTGEQSLLAAEEKGFAHLMKLPGVRDWWDENPYAFSPEFRSYMEGFAQGGSFVPRAESN